MSEVSLIIQGRPHPNSLDAIEAYLSYGPVILAYPEGSLLPSGIELRGVTLAPFTSKLADTTFNICSGYYHCLSILEGLKRVKTEFAIKLRSDVFVGNLQPLVDTLYANPDRYVCSHLYFRPDRVSKFHPSDQIVGMKTATFVETMEIALYRLTHHSEQLRQCFNDHRQTQNDLYTYYKGKPGSAVPNADAGMGHGLGLTPEVLFGTSYLAAKDIIQDPARSREIMREHFEVVCLEEMFPYKDRYGNVDKLHMGGLPVIRSMEEL